MFYLSDLSIPGSERCVHDGIEKGRENSSTVEAPKSLFREEKGTSDEVLEKKYNFCFYKKSNDTERFFSFPQTREIPLLQPMVYSRDSTASYACGLFIIFFFFWVESLHALNTAKNLSNVYCCNKYLIDLIFVRSGVLQKTPVIYGTTCCSCITSNATH